MRNLVEKYSRGNEMAIYVFKKTLRIEANDLEEAIEKKKKRRFSGKAELERVIQ